MRMSVRTHLILSNIGCAIVALILVYGLLSRTVQEQVSQHQLKSIAQASEDVVTLMLAARKDFDTALDFWLRDYHQEKSPLPRLRSSTLDAAHGIPLYANHALLLMNDQGELLNQRWQLNEAQRNWISTSTDELLNHLKPNEVRGVRSGVLFVANTPMLVALRPVILAGKESRHTLIAITPLTPELLQWSHSIGVRAFESIRLFAVPNAGLINLWGTKPDMQSLQVATDAPTQVYFKSQTGEAQFSAALTVSDAWKNGQHDLRNTLIRNLAILTLLICSCMAVLAMILFIRPINRLSDSIKAITDTHDFSLRVPEIGMFEMRSWASAFNRLLNEIETTNSALMDSEARHRALFEQSPVGALVFGKNYKVQSCNQSFSDMIALPIKTVIGVDIGKIVKGDVLKVLDKVLSGRKHVYQGVLQSNIVSARLWVSLRMSPIRDRHGEVVAGICLFENLSAQKQAESAFKKERERALATLNSIADAVVTTDISGQIEYMNPVAEKLCGWASHQAIGQSFKEIFKLIDGESREPIELSLELENRYDQDEHDILISQSGSEYAVRCEVTPLLDTSGQEGGSVIVMQNLTELRGVQKVVAYQAVHDDLTGLKNRKYFEENVQSAIDDAVLHGHTHAVCYLDLDQFKVINDTCGHAAGDELIRQISRHLQQLVKNPNLLCRFGGDEFGVLLWNVTSEQVDQISEQIRQAIVNLNFEWMGQKFEVGVSIGVVMIDESTNSLAEIFSTADTACFVAKESGRNRIQKCRPGDPVLAVHYGEIEWVNRIQRAIKEEKFCLYSQKIESLGNDSLPHFEVLVRMIDDRGGVIAPTSYVRAAERYRLMPAIDRWVIRQAFLILGSVPKISNQPEYLANINISGQSLSEESFLDFVLEQLEEFKIDPQSICFEITETAVIENINPAIQFMTTLKKRGILFALDDFGSGLSSFAYLKQLDVDFLKIDGSLVRDIAHNELDYAMVRAIQELGNQIHVKTIAEYVENEVILEKLDALGVDYVQGYAIHRPSPLGINVIKRLQKVAVIQ